MNKKQTLAIATSLLFGLSVISACGTTNTSATENQTASIGSTTSTTETVQLATTSESEDVSWTDLSSNEITLTDEGLTITETGTYVLTGSTTGQIVVDTEGDVRIILNNAEIKSSEGAAIYIANAEQTVIEMAEGTTNTVEDASTRSDEEIDGAIFSSDDLVFTGEGTLNVTANFEDGIVGKDDLWIEGGNINVTSVDDGIRGKDSLNISGGTLVVDAQGDGIKSSNDTDLEKGQLNISGGDITINSGDDAVKAEQTIWITGGTLNVENSVEGIEAPVIVIDDGDINVYATDDGINASASEIITTGINLTINGGNVTVEVGQGDTDALDSNGDLTIAGGTVTLTAQSAVDFDGTGSLTGGTLIVNGETLTELPQQMGGPGGGMMGGDPMGQPGGGQPGGNFGG